jgi:ribosomal protein S18 acetylase RimI-like enzyme
MSALYDATSQLETLELSHLGVSDLDPLLNEEIAVWDQDFHWDFRPSADLLRRFLHIHSLSGYALLENKDVIGYAYHVCEGKKGLIGDFYVRKGFADPLRELTLLGSVVQGLMLTPGIRRIESQLMLLQSAKDADARPESEEATRCSLRSAPDAAAVLRGFLNSTSGHTLPFARFLTRHDRFFMSVTSEAATALPPYATKFRARFVPWAEKYQEDIAHLVAAAYKGHVDSEINDQYRTIPGARHFLMNIVKFPGCGRFSPSGSVVAIDESNGRVCGACLSSMVAADSSHITQLCILPAVRGAHLGYELLRRGLLQLTRAGCRTVSLTVTCSNIAALRLYESVGFRSSAKFPALVWDGF